MKIKREVPIFFSADERYLPYMAVTLASLIQHANAHTHYAVYVLTADSLGANADKILAMQTNNVHVRFVNIAQRASEIRKFMRCRDYYTDAIYFRLFIPELFPQYEKAVYLDCDTVLLDDIANLYDEELGNHIIGAVVDQAVVSEKAFRAYTKDALGILPERYFNSGVLVMHLQKLRSLRFDSAFYDILSRYDFVVAPDQDCLNLICKNKVHYIDTQWNTMPIGGRCIVKPKLIHFNLTMKPWHYEGVAYEEKFWEFAKQTAFYDEILSTRNSFSENDQRRDVESGVRLLQLAQSEADNPNNYIRSQRNRLYEKAMKISKGGNQVWI